MGVITISRQYGAGGEEVAEKIAEELGYRVITRKEIEEKLSEVAGEKLSKKVLALRAPGIIERLSFDMLIWRNLIIESALFFAKDGGVVILGRGSFNIFRDIPGVLSILVTGEYEQRVTYTSEKEGIDAHQAEEKIRRVDRERSGFLKYFLGKDWPDPSQYHLSVNPLSVGIDESAKVIESLFELLDIGGHFEKDGKKVFQEKYALTASINRIFIYLGLDVDIYSLTVKGDKEVEIKFFNVTPELREKAISIVGEQMGDYTISVAE